MAMHKPGEEPRGAVTELVVEGETLVQRAPYGFGNGYWVTVVCDKYLPFVQTWIRNAGVNMGITRNRRKGRDRDGATDYLLDCNGVAVIDGNTIIYVPDDGDMCLKRYDTSGAYVDFNWKDE